MGSKILKYLLAVFFRVLLWFRYRIRVEGLDKLTKESLSREGGVLFLPNHPTVFVDPVAVALSLWPKFPIRPMIIEYMYNYPLVNQLMRLFNAIPIPSFRVSSNSLKKRRSEVVIQEMMAGLKRGENFLVYPAGRIKYTGYETVGGTSAVHRALQEVPETNVVLVRIKGLWGSGFSWALDGKPPDIFPVLWKGIKIVFQNLLFFTPRREVIVEFQPAPADFPHEGTRLELNRYLEQWYNQPDGLTKQEGDLPGDSLVRVPYHFWSSKLPKLRATDTGEDKGWSTKGIPKEVREKVVARLAKMADIDPKKIRQEMSLASDLGLDSLDGAELLAFLQDEFDVEGISVGELTTVGKFLALAAKKVVGEGIAEETALAEVKWKAPKKRKRVEIAKGDTIPEAFLNHCRNGARLQACGDDRSGMLTRGQLKTRVVLLASYIRTLPGTYVGILLPASVAANILVLAVQLAGKVPLMVNWTIGRRHLESVVEASQVEVVFTSWGFVDRLENVDFGPLEDKLVMLEDLRSTLGLWKKIKASILSKRSTKAILRVLQFEKTEEDPAVLLFTSGTENAPKGVPLSHANILSNQRACLESLALYNDDVIFGVLPPFHAFGFTLSGLVGLLSGVRVGYYPNPADGKGLAKGIARWKGTIMCGAPTFIKGMLKAAVKKQLRTMRLCITGAEKAPPELFVAVENLGKKNCLIEGYGITECSPVLTINQQRGSEGGVGAPLPNVSIRIVHPETHTSLADGIPGLILVRGPNIFSGYINAAYASPFLMLDGILWYNTGDIGFLDQKNHLTISGRLKRFVKIGAEMVSLASIEEALQQAAVDKKWKEGEQEGPALAVCAKEKPGEKTKIFLFTPLPLSLDQVNQSLRAAGFSNLIKVAQVMPIEEIPLMGSGKTNYRYLEKHCL